MFARRRPGVEVVSALLIAAKPTSYCEVLARVGRTTRLLMQLPLKHWNNRFYMAGCSGMCGILDGRDQVDRMNRGLRRGYTVATFDAGHSASTNLDASFADDNPPARRDFAYASLHKAVRGGKAIMTTFYGRAAKASFFDGCSTGGRQGLMEAQRYPSDFDGIIAGSPAFDAQGLVTYWTWIAQADQRPAGWIMTVPALRTLEAAVARQCGDEDGIVEDPRVCHFSVDKLGCDSARTSNCLTPEQSGVVERWYAGPRDENGRRLFIDGVPFGSEPYWDRPEMPSIFGPVMNFQKAAAGMGLQHLMIDPAPGAKFHYSDFKIGRDQEKLAAANLILTPKPKLEPFAARGGKLLVYQGWADPITPPLRTIAYIDQVRKELGKPTADSHIRLFLIPGFNHCGAAGSHYTPGVTASGMDFLAALERWADTGHAPDALLARKLDEDGSERWRRPICSYPTKAIFAGSGDRDRVASWRCSSGKSAR